MGLDIVNNIMAQDASNSLAINQSNMQNSLQKLSSGYQINKAADDASGLVISQHLQAQIGGFQQAQANTQSAINVVQTADGALNEVGTILQRINTLAVQSANTSATDATAQQAAQAEVDQSLASITNIAATTVYGNQNLLVNGTAGTVDYTFQVGYNDSAASQVTFSVTALTLDNLGLGTTLSATGDGVGSISGSGFSAGTYALVVTAGAATVTGGAISTLTGTGTSATLGLSAGTSFTISVNGGTAATITLTTNETLGSVLSALTAISGLSATLNTAGTGIVVNDTSGSIDISGTGASGVGFTAGTTYGSGATVSFNGGSSVTVSSASNVSGSNIQLTDASGNTVTVTLSGTLANNANLVATASNWSVTGSSAITTVDNAIQTVSAMRGTLGAYQNELQHVSDNESVMVQNLQASNAQIEDTNMASQMVSFTQNQVLVQAGVSMLAQANQLPQMVLKLLG